LAAEKNHINTLKVSGLVSTKTLADQTQGTILHICADYNSEFRALPDDQKTLRIEQILSSYEQEIYALSKRSTTAEDLVIQLASDLGGLTDPVSLQVKNYSLKLKLSLAAMGRGCGEV
jgi:hypothetical protein